MLSGSVFSKQYWTEAIATTCYTQNRSTIVKRHLKTSDEIFRKRILNIYFLHVFGCPVFIHYQKDHLGKFDEKADDGYLLGYSLVSMAFRRDTVPSSESALTFAELFKTNELKAQIQEKDTEKDLVITTLKEQLKGKVVLTKAVSLNPIDPVLLQVDVVPLVPKLRKNRTAHIDYIRHTQEEAATLREIVESERLLSPLNTSLTYVCNSEHLRTLVNKQQLIMDGSLSNLFKGGRILFRLVRQDHLYQDKEEHRENKGLLRVTTAKAKVACPSSAQNQGGSVMLNDCDEINSAKIALMANLSHYGSDNLAEVFQIVLLYLDSGCSKHMTGDRSQLINFVQKFLGTVKFRNDHVAKIMG
nr:retrovirus-related Pol polyprotein from transposon TNT 1-94 [Tanacetum cinerariifolium]